MLVKSRKIIKSVAYGWREQWDDLADTRELGIA
jgi:hypothetical protein